MHIAVFGASGSIGRHLVHQAQQRGHQLTVFGRDAERLPDPGPGGRKVEGDVFDPEAVAAALEGCDAVFVTLGAAPSDRNRIRARGTAAILRAMRSRGLERIVCTSCLGVGESYAPQDWFTRRVVLDLWLWRVVADHQTQEALLEQSDLAWTAVRPPHLSDRDDGEVQTFTAESRSPSNTIGRADLARFVLDAIEGERFVREHIGVCAA